MREGLPEAAKTALVDASSAILLYRGGLFAAVTAAYRVVMAASVFEEVTAPGHRGAAAFGRLYQNGCFAVLDPPASPIPDNGLPNGLHVGERDILRLYCCGCGDFIVIDDGKAAAHCRDAGIPFVNALLMPRILHLAGLVSADACAKAAQTIAGAGRYAGWVRAYAREASDAALMPFIPVESGSDLEY